MKKFFKNITISLLAAASLYGVNGCNKFLDVVPDDGLASIETAFNLRSTAIRYLATCYSYMTNDGVAGQDSGMLTGDDLWDLDSRVTTYLYNKNYASFPIAKGLQSAAICYNSDWKSMYEGIRCCDILVENIDKVPDMNEDEKQQWKAEVSFLKAYYHFNLIRKWGPVPIIRESLPIDSNVEEVRVYRDNIDDCFDFVLDLLDEALPYLPIVNPSDDELGRVTKPICAALKAKVAVYAASPLFNGNEEEASLVDGTTATVQLTESTSEMVATKFRYKNLDGEWVEFGPRMTPREVNFKLTNAMRGKYFEFSSGFLPSDGRDTAWMEWTKSSYPIVYPLDTKDWTVTATTGGTMGENTPDKIFDGIADANHRWHSTAGNNFPKILSIDTNCEAGKEPTYKTFSMARNPKMSYRYIFNFQIFTGNEPFNPDEKNFASVFGTPICNSLLYWGDNPGSRNCTMESGRYIAIVFTNSRNKQGYLDLWELTVWGYIEADAN